MPLHFDTLRLGPLMVLHAFWHAPHRRGREGGKLGLPPSWGLGLKRYYVRAWTPSERAGQSKTACLALLKAVQGHKQESRQRMAPYLRNQARSAVQESHHKCQVGSRDRSEGCGRFRCANGPNRQRRHARCALLAVFYATGVGFQCGGAST